MSKLSKFLSAVVIVSGRPRGDILLSVGIPASRFSRILSGRTKPRGDEAAQILKACRCLCSACGEVAIDAEYARTTAGLSEVVDEIPLPPPQPRTELPPLGPVVPVDVYECHEDGLRVEVTRTPGSDDQKVEMHMEMEHGDPVCPICEREMVRVSRRLQRATSDQYGKVAACEINAQRS